MFKEQNEGNELNTQVSDQKCSDEQVFKNITDTGNALILALEDMIELLGSNYKYGSSISNLNNKNVSIKNIKEKITNIKVVYSSFKKTVLGLGPELLKAYGVDVVSFQKFGDHIVDEVLTEWNIRADAHKAIDITHDMCYKVREIMRKLNRM